jgi:adenosylcobyric acid synthase
MAGLGLLPVVTTFEKEKVRTRVQGTVASVTGLLEPLSGMEVEGYEVHMGTTVAETPGVSSTFLNIRDTAAGARKQDGCFLRGIYGTYVHGFFDAGDIAPRLVKSLCAAKGIAYAPPDAGMEADFKAYKEQQYNLLARAIRGNVDMKKIYSILEDGIG